MYYNEITLTNGTVYYTEYQIRFTSRMKNNPGLWCIITANIEDKDKTICFMATEILSITITLKP